MLTIQLTPVETELLTDLIIEARRNLEDHIAAEEGDSRRRMHLDLQSRIYRDILERLEEDEQPY